MTREELIEAATKVHDDQGCGCDRRYLMSCPRLAAAVLEVARRPRAAPESGIVDYRNASS